MSALSRCDQRRMTSHTDWSPGTGNLGAEHALATLTEFAANSRIDDVQRFGRIGAALCEFSERVARLSLARHNPALIFRRNGAVGERFRPIQRVPQRTHRPRETTR